MFRLILALYGNVLLYKAEVSCAGTSGQLHNISGKTFVATDLNLRNIRTVVLELK